MAENLKGSISSFNTYHTDAYAIAVRNGFEGTEAEWLASLKGDKGKDYVLTETDKQDIADIVLDALPNGDEVAY